MHLMDFIPFLHQKKMDLYLSTWLICPQIYCLTGPTWEWGMSYQYPLITLSCSHTWTHMCCLNTRNHPPTCECTGLKKRWLSIYSVFVVRLCEICSLIVGKIVETLWWLISIIIISFVSCSYDMKQIEDLIKQIQH